MNEHIDKPSDVLRYHLEIKAVLRLAENPQARREKITAAAEHSAETAVKVAITAKAKGYAT